MVCEELNAAGCGLLMMVVSPAINGTIIARFGTDEQKQRWLPGLADGSTIMAFGITEPDAGSNSHNITTTARRDGDDWVLNGRKIYVSGVDHADAILIVARTQDERTGRLKPALFAFPTDTPGFEYRAIDMDVVMPDRQFLLFLDDVRLPADALIGQEDAALAQLFAGLTPSGSWPRPARSAWAATRWTRRPPTPTSARCGAGRSAPTRACRTRWPRPRSSWSWPSWACRRRPRSTTPATRWAPARRPTWPSTPRPRRPSPAWTRPCRRTAATGWPREYGLGNLLIGARVARIAPVSREMILNFVAQFSLGLPKSY